MTGINIYICLNVSRTCVFDLLLNKNVPIIRMVLISYIRDGSCNLVSAIIYAVISVQSSFTKATVKRNIILT